MENGKIVNFSKKKKITRRSWFQNFSNDSLFTLIEQSTKELSYLETSFDNNKKTKELASRIRMVKYNIYIFANQIIKNYLDSGVSLNDIAHCVVNNDGIIGDIYQEIFTLKLLEKDRILDLELLENVINKLDIEFIHIIMVAKKGTIYEKLATKRFNELIFDVEEDVLDDLKIKIKRDERGN